ncbi:MAG: ABC-type multidrug transport system ATPase subunit [Myxococcota bacterium]|jgi:ABC-type multidrug transport system ATPase subunit
MTGRTLRANGVEVRAGGRTLLTGIDASLRPGELVGLIGPSGAGKSTLMEVLLGLRAHRGQVTLGDGPLDMVGVAWVPQDDVLFSTLTARRWLDYATRLRLHHLTPEERTTRLRVVAEQVGLSDRLNVRIRRLSGGQRKRVSVATELLTQPSVLICDEPTSGLDPGLETRMMALFSDLARADRIVLVATHAMQSLDRCDRLWILAAGRLVSQGTPSEALTQYNVVRFADLFARLEST